MAYSQVEIASAFGCVLKDRNRREICNRDCNTTIASAATQAAFQKNLKELVRDHLCISVSSVSPLDDADADDPNLQQNHRNLTTCITNDNYQEDENTTTTNNNKKDSAGKQQARILDRWAAKQAEEIVSTIQTEDSLSSSSSSCQGNNDNSDHKASNLGASSLVQMWEARLHPPHIKIDRSNSYKNSPKAALTTTSSTTNNETIEPKFDASATTSRLGSSSSSSKTSPSTTSSTTNNETTEPKSDASTTGSRLGSRSSSSKTSPTCASGNDDEITAAPSRNENLVEPNAMTASASSSARTSGANEDLFVGLLGRSISDAGDSERVRIADIIKRLKSDNTNENHERGSSTSICEAAAAAAEQKSFALVVNVNSLKIRGRQAFNDLLVQMEQERHKELNSIGDRRSVTKFAHRGRLQSMLRVRSLQRGMAIQNRQREQYQSAESTAPFQANRSHHSSTIMSLRERFSRGLSEDGTASSLTPKSGKEIEINSTVNNENRTRTLLQQDIKSNHCEDISVTNQRQAASAAPTSKSFTEMMIDKCISNVDHKNDHNPGISSSPDHKKQASQCGKEIDNSCVINKNCSTMTKTNNYHEDFCTKEQQADSLSQTSEVHDYDDDVHEESSARSDVTWQGIGSEVNNFRAGEALESAPSMDNWEGSEQDFENTHYDWFNDIARPRSYWEDLRRGWYEQMLTCSSEDNEIKQLLQRKTVSSFLAGDFRSKMDQMIMSHVQIQANKEEEELEEEGQERMGQLIMSFLQRQSHSSRGDEEQREDLADTEDGQEEENEHEQQVEEQEPANPLSTFSSWNYNRHQLETDDSENVVHPSEGSIDQDRRVLPSANHPSTEMELKVQMEQLQREMYELRKAMQACLEMQSQLRSSIQPETANDNITKERKCCICNDKQVEAFLYRCGHMCTCLRCAHELQWSSGKCVVCRAPILDVVRAYMD